MKKLLFINPYGIGDVLFTTPLIRAVKETLPHVKIGYLCNSRSAEILKNNPSINCIFIYDRDEFVALRKKSFFSWLIKCIKLLLEIRKESFDAALDFSLNRQYGFISWVVGIKKRVGYNFKRRGVFLTHKIALAGYQKEHIVGYYGGLLKFFGFGLENQKLELFLKDEDIKKTESILKENNINETDLLIAIIPGAGRSWGNQAYFKHWSAQSFAGLADKLVEKYQAKIIILGDSLENDLADAVLENMHYKPLNLSGKTTVAELAALLTKVRIAVTNDGGPMHIACALGVKTVSIFGPVDDAVYGPYPKSRTNVLVKKDLPCRPCYKNFRFTGCSYSHKCIKDLSVDEVFEAVRSLI